MKKCNKCPICPFVQVGQKVSASKIKFSIDINTEVKQKILYMSQNAKSVESNMWEKVTDPCNIGSLNIQDMSETSMSTK